VLAEGEGPEAAVGDLVLVDYVIRRSNGYFIYSTVEGVSFQPRDVPVGPVAFRLGDGRLVPGLEGSIVGMRRGAKRRVLVPAEAAYAPNPAAEPQPPTTSGRRQVLAHQAEPFLFEVQVLRITPGKA